MVIKLPKLRKRVHNIECESFGTQKIFLRIKHNEKTMIKAREYRPQWAFIGVHSTWTCPMHCFVCGGYPIYFGIVCHFLYQTIKYKNNTWPPWQILVGRDYYVLWTVLQWLIRHIHTQDRLCVHLLLFTKNKKKIQILCGGDRGLQFEQ